MFEKSDIKFVMVVIEEYFLLAYCDPGKKVEEKKHLSLHLSRM